LKKELLVRYGADVNARDNKMRTPLHYANSVEEALFLIRNDANPNIRDVYGDLPNYVKILMGYSP